MSKQLIYDAVKAHLLAQNEKSTRIGTDGNVYNAYHQPATMKKCAIGCLILDALYATSIEGKNVEDPAVMTLLRNSAVISDAEMIDGSMQRFLRQLQDIHDTMTTTDWSAALTELAKFNALTP